MTLFVARTVNACSENCVNVRRWVKARRALRPDDVDLGEGSAAFPSF